MNDPTSSLSAGDAPNDGVRRRVCVALAAAAAMPRVARAQSSDRRRRIGWLGTATTRSEPYAVAFSDRLRELGFEESRNLVIDFRNAEGRVQRLPELAAELVRAKCEVLFAPGNELALAAAERASSDVPIVIVANDYDPVATGHIPNLARPGGRTTGVTQLQTELPAKRLEMLKLLLPGARKVAVLGDVTTAGQLAATRAATNGLGVSLLPTDLRKPPYDYPAAFADIAKGNPDALVVLQSGIFATARRELPALALKHRLATMFGNALWVDAGALASYGLNFSELYRRAADQVARILNGAKPGELPVEQPTAFELAINLRTAKALGVSIPQAVALRATHVVQ